MIYNDNLRAIGIRLGEIQDINRYPSTIEGVNQMSTRLSAAGGFPQQDRMIRDKYRTLLRALKYSY